MPQYCIAMLINIIDVDASIQIGQIKSNNLILQGFTTILMMGINLDANINISRL